MFFFSGKVFRCCKLTQLSLARIHIQWSSIGYLLTHASYAQKHKYTQMHILSPLLNLALCFSTLTGRYTHNYTHKLAFTPTLFLSVPHSLLIYYLFYLCLPHFAIMNLLCLCLSQCFFLLCFTILSSTSQLRNLRPVIIAEAAKQEEVTKTKVQKHLRKKIKQNDLSINF